MAIHPDIEDYHAGLAEGDRAICDRLCAAIQGGLKGAEGKVWHRHPVWFIDGNPIVGYHTLKGNGGCVRLLFWSGQSFDEPGLLPAPPGTKFKSAAAHYTEVGQIAEKDLKRWLKKGASIQWDYKNIVKRKGRLVRISG